MAVHARGNANRSDRFVQLDDGGVPVVEDGRPDAPALLLLTNAAGHPSLWDPVVPLLARTHRVLRVDPLGRTASRSGGYDVQAQAGRVAAVLDRLGVGRVTVCGHSSGCMVATALAQQRPDTVVALALLDMGPDLDAEVPDGLLARLVLTRFPGGLLWRLRTAATIRKAARSGFTRPVELPQAWIEHLRSMRHRDFLGVMRGYRTYLGQRSLPDRLAGSGLRLLVIFGADDQRWRSSSALAYHAVPGARVELLPGVGHTPMMEDPAATARLLAEFAAAAEPSH